MEDELQTGQKNTDMEDELQTGRKYRYLKQKIDPLNTAQHKE